GRVVDVSVSGVGLLVAEEIPLGTGLRVNFALPGLDDQALPVVATVVVRSARPGPSGGGRPGATIAQVDSSSRDTLVRYCFVVHPCVRLRESRLGAHEPASAPVVPISAVSPPPEADTPTGYSDEGRRMMS